MRKKNKTTNLLELIPAPNVNWEMNDKNTIVLLKPKFSNRLIAKYLLPKMKRPHYKIHLDEFGSRVWQNCNGKNTVADIAEILKKEFGEKIEPVHERLGFFIRTLVQNKFIYYVNY